jgi:hypothetical protein
MTDEARPHGLFTAAIDVMLAPDASGKATRERMVPALEGAGIPASFAGIVASAMVCACNATYAKVEPTLAELQAQATDLRHAVETQDGWLDELQERLDAQDGDARPLSPDQVETARVDRVSHWPPVVLSRCADCDVGTIVACERYMVKDELWAQAWEGRCKRWQRAPGQMVLCVGCLEQRLGRELCATDFTDAPLNHPDQSHMSRRLLDRLKRPSARIGKPTGKRRAPAPQPAAPATPRRPRRVPRWKTRAKKRGLRSQRPRGGQS